MYLHSPTAIEAKLMAVKRKIKQILDEESDDSRRVQLCEELFNYTDEMLTEALITRDRQEYIDASLEGEEE